MARSDIDDSALKAGLANLERELRIRAPVIAEALRPSISPANLERISKRLTFELPPEVRDLFQWHDGSASLSNSYRPELFPGGQMLSLEEAAEALNDALIGDRESEMSRWNSGWLPVFTDGMGSWQAVACTDPSHPVVNIYFVDLPATHEGYANLQEMVEVLVGCWRTGAYRQGVDGAVDEDARAVAAVRRAREVNPPNLDRLMLDLSEGSIEQYVAALEHLQTRLYPQAVGSLIRLLETGNARARKAAAELLGAIGDPTARDALGTASRNDPDDMIRVYAVQALGQLRREDASSM